MEKGDAFYFWIRGIMPYFSGDLEDYLNNRDSVKHRRNGILVLIPLVTIEVTPKEVKFKDFLERNNLKIESSPDIDLKDVENYSTFFYNQGRIYDRFKSVEDNAYITPNFFDDFLEPYMLDINNIGTKSTRTVQNLLVQYRRGRNISIVHSALDLDVGKPKRDLLKLLRENSLTPQAAT